MNPGEGKAMKEIIAYLRNQVKGDESKITGAWEYILQNLYKCEPFLAKQIKLVQLNSNLVNLINQIKHGNYGDPNERLRAFTDAINRSL